MPKYIHDSLVAVREQVHSVFDGLVWAVNHANPPVSVSYS